MRQLRTLAIRLLRVLGLIENIPNDWQEKMRLAAEFGVTLSGLPFGGSDENILLAQNGVLLDERIREELKRRRERIARWFIPLRVVLCLKGLWH